MSGIFAGLGKQPVAVRVATGNIAGGATATISAAFPAGAFDDTNYAATAIVEGPSLRIVRLANRLATTVDVVVVNDDTLNQRSGEVHVVAVRL